MIRDEFDLRYVINDPDVVAEDFDGQVVILNLSNGHYYSLEGCAGDIWQLLSFGHSPAQVLLALREARPDLAKDCAVFIDTLIEKALVRPDAEGGVNAMPIAVEWNDLAPRLEVYDDLAELIYADPIHDVDEAAGWPKPRE
ncbi:MAG: hypothetical protein CML29_05830 [Rhizobiales bacterium]|nr:hypothetical protein [Hyphomicrobiales bacterium]MBA68365.1 hypothetical protein [Hyphomicrobiales bacterium]|tara:strand:- start:220 stop:642 length:423 start_codon:yes stop_codon:yes gene_type:complete